MSTERALGDKLALSIPTSVPFEEKVVGDGPKPDELWMNVKTLFRNFWGSWSNAERPPVSTMFGDFVDELRNIKGLCENQNIRPVFYHLSYASLPRKFPHAKLVEPRTENQLAYATAERVMMEVAIKQLEGEVVLGDVDLPGSGGRVWIMTSFPVDLLNRFKFTKLEMLESHTGKIKSPAKWFSKLNKREDIQHFPFNSFMLQLFGDKSTMFGSLSTKVKNRVIDLGLEKKWHTSTTQTRIKENLSLIEDEDVRKLCLNLINSR